MNRFMPDVVFVYLKEALEKADCPVLKRGTTVKLTQTSAFRGQKRHFFDTKVVLCTPLASLFYHFFLRGEYRMHVLIATT